MGDKTLGNKMKVDKQDKGKEDGGQNDGRQNKRISTRSNGSPRSEGSTSSGAPQVLLSVPDFRGREMLHQIQSQRLKPDSTAVVKRSCQPTVLTQLESQHLEIEILLKKQIQINSVLPVTRAIKLKSFSIKTKRK